MSPAAPEPTWKKRHTALVVFGVLCLVLALGVMRMGGGHSGQPFVRWLALDVQLKLKLEPDASAGWLEEQLAKNPVPLARIVREFQIAWRGAKKAEVHEAASEVAACLLHHAEYEVGDLVDGKFVPWPLAPWDAAGKIERDLTAMDDFLENESRYVFRRK